MTGLRDLPVSVDLPGVLGQEVTSYVEVEAGWQVVAESGPPAPALVLTAAPRPGRPTVVIVQGAPTPEQVRDGLLGGALDVLGWPADRDRLLDAPLRVRATPRGAGPSVLGVAGLAGGVGTSTVALAMGGLLAWSGKRTVVVGDEDLLRLCGADGWRGPGAAELAALEPASAGAELPGLLRPLPGVPGLSVLGGGGAAVGGAAGWAVDAVVADLRALPLQDAVSPGRTALRGASLLVGRPDGSLRAAAAAPPDLAVLVAGSGPLDHAGVRRLLGRQPVGWLPESARVAQAGVRGRVPSSLPGSWLAVLRTASGRVRR